MKYFLGILLLMAVSANAQNLSSNPGQNFLDSMSGHRAHLFKKHMIILGSWGVANIGIGIGAGNSAGSNHYFHQMNLYWGIANFGIAALGILSGKQQTEGSTWSKTLKDQHRMETIIAVNGGLDIGYIMAGLYLKERGQGRANEKLTGYGNSIILQGGFLLAFDIFQYLEHRKDGKNLENAVDKWQLGTTANGLGMVYRF